MTPPAPDFPASTAHWLGSGDAFFESIKAAVQGARRTIRLEMYIYSPRAPGDLLQQMLIDALHRRVEVTVLLDFLGSNETRDRYWDAFKAAGGKFRWFNPSRLRPIRDHRKLLVVDENIAFVGGFNVAPEYIGDGIIRGWRDAGIRLEGPVAGQLADVFDSMYLLASQPQRMVTRLRLRVPVWTKADGDMEVLPGAPGLGRSELLGRIYRDVARATRIHIITPYFLPPRPLRRLLQQAARRGGDVTLILPGRSDVVLARQAAQSLYSRLLKSGIHIYEYQPQVLHAKVMIIDEAVYVGSSNLDPRSLAINYELCVRTTDRMIREHAQGYFAETRSLSKKIDLPSWTASRPWWQLIRERWAHFLLARVDPWGTHWLTRA